MIRHSTPQAQLIEGAFGSASSRQGSACDGSRAQDMSRVGRRSCICAQFRPYTSLLYGLWIGTLPAFFAEITVLRFIDRVDAPIMVRCDDRAHHFLCERGV
jgi:hypothetical protein